MASKLITGLSEKIFENNIFYRDYESLLKSVLFNDQKLEESQINKLLQSACILSLSDDENFQRLASKIVLFLITKYRDEYSAIPFLTEVVLTRLGDLPTINHVIKRNHGKDFFSYFQESTLPLNLYLKYPEMSTTKIMNQIPIGTKTAHFTNFQSKIFNWLSIGHNASFSAPTSSGKSYVLQNFIIKQILKEYWHNTVYLVPTKSLMFEIQKNLVSHLHSLGIETKDAMVVTSGNESTILQLAKVRHKILILTQERLQQLLSNKKDIPINLLIVDEAQKVNDDTRGVILEDAVNELVNRYPKIQIVFISPNTKLPEKFKKIFDIQRPLESGSIRRTPVGQNIFFVDFNEENVSLKLFLQEFKKDVDIQTLDVKLKSNERHQYALKAWTATHFLKNQGHTLVYCNYPKECMKVADKMMTELKQKDNKAINEAIDFLKTHVHEEYFLIKHLQYGIGYHYGNMPQFVRFIVKDLFDSKTINYLCCTSTLLEGVNLPANNIVLHHPKSGSSPMDRSSILNLAGRAGRLGKEYYGNIYCVNMGDWKLGQDTFDGELDEVTSSVEKTLTDNVSVLLQHLENYTVQPRGTKNVEAVATSLIIKQLRYSSSDFLYSLKKRYPTITSESIEQIKTNLQKIVSEISTLDKDIMLKNPSIDPRLQHSLYVYLKNTVELIYPPFPESKEFINHLRLIFKLIATYLMNDRTESFKFHVLMAHFWIHQRSYKHILENRLGYETTQLSVKLQKLEDEALSHESEGNLEDARKLNEKINKFLDLHNSGISDDLELTSQEINDIIDNLNETLERKIKFEYTKGLKCYCDIIEKILDERHLEKNFCADLPDFLEVGAFDPKVILLMGLGISRNASITISHIIKDDISTIIDALEWLRKNKELVKGKVHELVFKEIKDLLK